MYLFSLEQSALIFVDHSVGQMLEILVPGDRRLKVARIRQTICTLKRMKKKILIILLLLLWLLLHHLPIGPKFGNTKWLSKTSRM